MEFYAFMLLLFLCGEFEPFSKRWEGGEDGLGSVCVGGGGGGGGE